jgi:hypothetical protein
MNTYTWIIEAMDCKPQEGSLTDVVITAYWRCNGTNGQDGIFDGTVYNTCSFSQPGDPFTPYADLTQEQVLGWCWSSGVDKDATEANIDGQIASQVNPPVIQPPLPWASTTP